jgi:hypothetical protein
MQRSLPLQLCLNVRLCALGTAETGMYPINLGSDGDGFTDDFQINTNHTINISIDSPNP